MSFWATLEADINKGLETAAVVIGVFEPSLEPLLTEIATIVGDVETIFGKPASQIEPSTVSAAVQAGVAAHVVKQKAAIVTATTAATAKAKLAS